MPSNFLQDLGDNNAKPLYSEHDLRWSTLENSWDTIKLSTTSVFFISKIILETELK